MATESSEDVTKVVTPERERSVRLDDKLDGELMAIAELAGVQDIPGTWLKFTGHYADQWIHVAGKWQLWCVNETKRERSERERGRLAVLRKAADEPPSNAELGMRERKARELAEREKGRSHG